MPTIITHLQYKLIQNMWEVTKSPKLLKFNPACNPTQEGGIA